MKKLFWIVNFLCISTTFWAQSKVKLGINGGLNYSSLRGNELSENLKSGFSFLGGISFEYFVKENISINANVNFEQKLVKDDGYFYLTDEYGYTEAYKSDSKLKYNYLIVPVYASYYFGSKKDFYVNGGFFTGYLIDSKYTSKQFNSTKDTTEMNKKSDFGLVFGFGKLFELNEKNNLKVELRENLGLVNTSDIKVFNDGTIKTNSINLILNWSFNL